MGTEQKQARARFSTDNEALARVYAAALAGLRGNLRDFGGRRVLIEGAGYDKIWLETQPMGGEMYAEHDMEAALNNSLLFMEHARPDGRIPGSIQLVDGKRVAQFNKFQGFCFPGPALNMYYWAGLGEEYLHLLRDTLRNFDAYLWKTRDSDGDGCLESWCVTDTGEDGAKRYGDAPFWWEEESPPRGFTGVPMASMDVMSFSYSARDVLAKISRILEDGEENIWRAKAEGVRAKIRSSLWDEKRGACFDRAASGIPQNVLAHNTLRCMYWGSLYPDMAARFTREHLLNPAEFWTPFPLPSVAVSDPLFRNSPGNDWSGQPQGLTWQRAIQALCNDGFDYIVPMLGEKLFAALGRDGVFTQQFDPMSGKPTGGRDGYGPTMLALTEYAAFLHGVRVRGETLRWGAWGGRQTEYALDWGEREYRIVCDGNRAEATVDGKPAFSCDCGASIVTDDEGNVLKMIPLREGDR